MNDNPNNPADAWAQVVTLAAGLAHEIKNPLSTINLNLQLLQEDWQNPQSPKQRRTLKRLNTLHREAQRLATLLDDFLRYARTPDLEPRPCALNDLLSDLADFVRPEAATRNIKVRSDLAADLPLVAADPKLLRQAILNLFINAQQAMPDGGELIVQTAAPDPAHVQIDITDTGGGIPDHSLHKIFNVYFSTKQGGSGLGLSTAQRIILRHGGTITVESEIHKGTHFAITLPLEPPTRATPAVDH